MKEAINNLYFTHEEIRAILIHYGQMIRDKWSGYEEKIPYECYRRLFKECIKGVRFVEDINNVFWFYDDDEAKYKEAKEYYAENTCGNKIARVAIEPTEPLVMAIMPEHDFYTFIYNYYLIYRPDFYTPRKDEKEDNIMATWSSKINDCTISCDTSNKLYYDSTSNGAWTTTSTGKAVNWNNINDTWTITLDDVNVGDALKELAGAVETTGQVVGKFGTEINKLNNKNEKENKKMKGFNFDFGPCTNDNIRMSMYGIAIKNQNGEWVSYNPSTGEIINVDIFNFDGRKYMFKMPVALKDVAVGDVVIHQKKAMIVLEVCGDESGIVVVDTHAGEEKKIIPTSNMFGFNFVTKVVSMFSAFAAAPTPDAPFGNFLPFLMMDGDNKDIDPMMMMFMMNGGNMGDMFSNPMMMYFLMKDNGNDNMLPLMMMMGQGCGHNCKCGK